VLRGKGEEVAGYGEADAWVRWLESDGGKTKPECMCW
jgi:hypothetical protein